MRPTSKPSGSPLWMRRLGTGMVAEALSEVTRSRIATLRMRAAVRPTPMSKPVMPSGSVGVCGR